MANPETPRPDVAPSPGNPLLTRRRVLGGMAGVAGLAAVPSLIAACAPSASTAPSAAPAASQAPAGSQPAASAPAASQAATGGTVSIGSYHTDPGEPEGQVAVNNAFEKATGINVAMNLVDHSTYQNQIGNYLQGTPETAYTWFSGFRMKFFAAQGLTVPIDDLWATVKDNFTEGFQQSVVGDDGKVYGIPVDYYPWAVFYRKSLWQEKGYQVPATWDDLKTLSQKMQGDGLTPIAFADQEGWPAMGTFDILNLRLNGYDFHVGLMAGKEKWTDPKVTTVFQKWAEILPYHAKDYAGLKWVDAATTLLNKKSGMYLLG
jgi:multiple sugar transport system substrate-binding protein